MSCDSINFLALLSALTLNPITCACALKAKLISDSVMPPTALYIIFNPTSGFSIDCKLLIIASQLP